jgi:hypothetical protein
MRRASEAEEIAAEKVIISQDEKSIGGMGQAKQPWRSEFYRGEILSVLSSLERDNNVTNQKAVTKCKAMVEHFYRHDPVSIDRVGELSLKLGGKVDIMDRTATFFALELFFSANTNEYGIKCLEKLVSEKIKGGDMYLLLVGAYKQDLSLALTSIEYGQAGIDLRHVRTMALLRGWEEFGDERLHARYLDALRNVP